MPSLIGHYVRAGPGTSVFLAVLLLAHVWLGLRDDPGAVLAWVSTNSDNLADHPLGALAGSLLFFDGAVTSAGSIITLGFGVAGALWFLEARHGTLRAAGVFLAGHIGGTLLTAVVIAAAVRAGRYPEELRSTLDFGISYGAEAALAAVTPAMPRWAWAPWMLFVLGWPLADSAWFGLVPDFTTVGHLICAAIGVVLGVVLVRSRAHGAGRRPPRRSWR